MATVPCTASAAGSPDQGYTESGGVVTLRGAGSSSCEIYLHGATVTSWRDKHGQERLYMSPTAVLDGSAPIRGGIPVCWPQFGPGPRWPQQHGFARRLPWALVAAEMDRAAPRAVLRLVDTEATRAAAHFPHPFELTLCVALDAAGGLSVALRVKNAGAAAFSFSTALHAYFAVENVGAVEIRGLRGKTYKDNADGLAEKVEEEEMVRFAGEVDRCYIGAPDDVSVGVSGVGLRKRGLPELVVWNPFAEKTRALPDMPDDAWRSFVCVEPAAVYPLLELSPGQVYDAVLELSAPLRSE